MLNDADIVNHELVAPSCVAGFIRVPVEQVIRYVMNINYIKSD